MKLLILATFATALLAGCGEAPAPTTPDQDADGNYLIHMATGTRFFPADAQVPVGATVRWVNDDAVVHNVWADDKSFSSPQVMKQAATFDHTFAAAGHFPYSCTLHSGMTANLHVV